MTIIICHISSIIYWYLAIYEQKFNDGDNWLKHYEIQNESWNKIYLEAFYYQLTTISTVGYGDYLPVSNKEKVFILFSMMFSSAVFAYVLTCFGEILQELNRQKLQQKKDVLFMSQILENKKTNHDLKVKAINYVISKNENLQQLSLEEEEEILNELPIHLKNQIILESNMEILKQLQVFDNFTQQTQELIAKKIVEERYQQNDIIIQMNNDQNNEAKLDAKDTQKKQKLYFIGQGSISKTALVKNMNNITQYEKQIQTFYPKQLFDYQFFRQDFDISCNYIIKATENTTLYSISCYDFIEAVQNQAQDYQQYRQIVDSIQFPYSKNTLAVLYCQGCKISNQSIEKCQFLHYQPEITQIILKYNYSQFQERQKQYQRKEKGYFQCLVHNFMVAQNAYEFQDDYISEEEEYQNDSGSSYPQSDHSIQNIVSDSQYIITVHQDEENSNKSKKNQTPTHNNTNTNSSQFNTHNNSNQHNNLHNNQNSHNNSNQNNNSNNNNNSNQNIGNKNIINQIKQNHSNHNSGSFSQTISELHQGNNTPRQQSATLHTPQQSKPNSISNFGLNIPEKKSSFNLGTIINPQPSQFQAKAQRRQSLRSVTHIFPFGQSISKKDTLNNTPESKPQSKGLIPFPEISLGRQHNAVNNNNNYNNNQNQNQHFYAQMQAIQMNIQQQNSQQHLKIPGKQKNQKLQINTNQNIEQQHNHNFSNKHSEKDLNSNFTPSPISSYQKFTFKSHNNYYQNCDMEQAQQLKFYKKNDNLNFKNLIQQINLYQKLDKNFGKYTYFNYKTIQINNSKAQTQQQVNQTLNQQVSPSKIKMKSQNKVQNSMYISQAERLRKRATSISSIKQNQNNQLANRLVNNTNEINLQSFYNQKQPLRKQSENIVIKKSTTDNNSNESPNLDSNFSQNKN